MQELQLKPSHKLEISPLENLDELKQSLSEALSVYQGRVYSIDNLKLAKEDKATLSKLKKTLDDRRKEIKNFYMEPYLEIERQIKELTALIDDPLSQITEFVKGVEAEEKAQKRVTIKEYYDHAAASLGSIAESLYHSPAFYDTKWENKTTSAKVWQDAISNKISQAVADISVIQATGGIYSSALLTQYLESMDMDKVITYKKALEDTEQKSSLVECTDDDDHVLGYKTLKVFGTQQQMAQLIAQIELMGLEFDELEDGMPKEQEELTSPNFDSFVSFDIETTGTYGAANGDGPAEITEIGAVKVVNGEIVDRFDMLCNPGRKILPRIARITKITDAMVADAPPVSEVIRQFAAFTEDYPLLGHNIKGSDLHYITKAAKRAGISFTVPFFDTYLYAKQFKEKEGWESLKLEYLSKKFGIEHADAHRAWCDAEVTALLYFKLKP